jgi:hypothetical protein
MEGRFVSAMIVDPFLFSSQADPKTSVPDRTSPLRQGAEQEQE